MVFLQDNQTLYFLNSHWPPNAARNLFIFCSFPFPRKKCLLLNNIFLMTGSLLAVTSRAARSFEMIIISRVLIGINAGMSFLCLFTLISCIFIMHVADWNENWTKMRQWSKNNAVDTKKDKKKQQQFNRNLIHFTESYCVFCRDQHECATHVFWRKCTKALKRRYLLVISCFHIIWCCVRTGGRTQVWTLTSFCQNKLIFNWKKRKICAVYLQISTVTLWVIYL